MKPLLTLIAGLCVVQAWAQPRSERTVHTLFDNPADSITGGYFALTGSSLNTLGQDAFLLGGRLGLVLGHRMAFGLAGYGLCNPLTSHTYDAYRERNQLNVPDGLAFRMGYGGLFVEPILFDRSVVHLSFPITVGAGGASYGYMDEGGRYARVKRTDGQAFFFVQPAMEIEVNIIQALRLGVGASYLYTSDIHLPVTDADLLRKPMFQVTLKAGRF